MLGLSRTAAVLSAAALVSAQTSTTCNPLTNSCPQDTALDTSTFYTDFTTGDTTGWVLESGTTLSYSSQGAAFEISSAGQAPTIHTNFYIFFGYIEVVMQAAPGTGIVSSVVMESDDLDEIDWEFLGGVNSNVQTNFFGKGNTTTYDREINATVATPSAQYHTYAVDWTSESITWLIDGTAVRSLPYSSSLALGGQNYPQTPMKVLLGSWCGGCSSAPGTVAWAGGAANLASGPYTMYVKSVKITNYNPGSAYQYNGNSGSYQNIQVIDPVAGGSSAIASPSSTSISTSTSTSASTSTSSTNASTSVGSSTLVQPTTSSAAASSASPTTSSTSTSSSISTTSSSTSSSAPIATVKSGGLKSATTPWAKSGIASTLLGLFAAIVTFTSS